MLRGKKYSFVSDSSNDKSYRPKHPLIKALQNKGFSDIDLCYASHWATDAGWNLMNARRDGKLTVTWLGYTIKEAIKFIHDNL